MIYGEIVSDESYYDLYPKILDFISSRFSAVEPGVQGDAYIWIHSNAEKVSLDTFTSMRFQIKSEQNGGVLVEEVISALEEKFKLWIYTEPEPEPHE